MGLMDQCWPGFSRTAALLVAERHVSLIGVDTASVDIGPSQDFLVHRTIGAANVPGLGHGVVPELFRAKGEPEVAIELMARVTV